jgi:hypothetical protein
MKRETIYSLTTALVLTALIMFGSSHQQVQAAPAVKKLRVTDGGEGTFACSASRLVEGGTTTSASAAAGIQIAVTADKITGKVSGTWQIVFEDGSGVIASGDITGGKMKADSFTLTGVETFSFFGGSCGPTPLPVTFTGQCGTDVSISLKGERQQPDLSQTETAIFRDVNVSCTK